MTDTPLRTSSNVPYLVAVVAMIVIAIMAIVIVTIARPDADNTAVFALILGSTGPTTLALLAFMKSQETHLSVNSRLDAMMANAERASRAEGVEAGRTAQKDDDATKTNH